MKLKTIGKGLGVVVAAGVAYWLNKEYEKAKCEHNRKIDMEMWHDVDVPDLTPEEMNEGIEPDDD